MSDDNNNIMIDKDNNNIKCEFCGDNMMVRGQVVWEDFLIQARI